MTRLHVDISNAPRAKEAYQTWIWPISSQLKVCSKSKTLPGQTEKISKFYLHANSLTPRHFWVLPLQMLLPFYVNAHSKLLIRKVRNSEFCFVWSGNHDLSPNKTHSFGNLVRLSAFPAGLETKCPIILRTQYSYFHKFFRDFCNAIVDWKMNRTRVLSFSNFREMEVW